MKYPVLLCKYSIVSIHTSVLHNYSRCSTYQLEMEKKKDTHMHSYLNMYVHT